MKKNVRKKVIVILACMLLIVMSVPGSALNDHVYGKSTGGATTRAPRNGYALDDNFNTATEIFPKYDSVNIIDVQGNFSPGDTIDCYKFNASKGDANGNNADKMFFWLHDNNTTSGVYMELYAPKPYTHRLAISEVHDILNPQTTPGYFEMVAPLNGTYYIKVISNSLNPGPNDGYALSFYFEKEPMNSGYPPGDNSFANARAVDTTKSITFISNQYLDPVWDIHDFYNFTGYKNQTLEITLKPDSTADYDLYLFDQLSVVPFRKSEIIQAGGVEKIKVTLTETKTYYVRVWAKYNGTIKPPNNYGRYSIEFKGNIPPFWIDSAKKYYALFEDDPPIYIEPEDVWKDLNTDDEIEYLLWNITEAKWEPRANNEVIISTVYYDNFKTQLINNGTIFLPDEVICITPLNNKFGISEAKLGVRDSPAETIGMQNITIEINPINDPPIINNTMKWTRFLPDELTVENNKISVDEENDVKIQVTAYDIEGDSMTFSDNSELFDINPATGLISFYADFTLIGPHKINITATDDGTNPDQLSTTLTITLEIKGQIDHKPKTRILGPENNSIIKTLFPTLIWNVSDIDTDPDEITYDVYLSTDLNEILTLSKNALIQNAINITTYSLKQTEPLEDNVLYYWTVIPFDGIFTGICINDYSQFIVDTRVIAPEVTLVSPRNGSILNYTFIEFEWSIEYDGDMKVFSDIYIGTSELDLTQYEVDYQDTSYSYEFISGHPYYWKVIPKAGVPPSRVTGEESPIFTFEIQKGYQPPIVKLTTPVNSSILKENKVTLNWEVNYKRPQDVGYEVYLSETLVFGSIPYEIVQGQRYLELTDLSNKVYYWKIVPFVGDNPGPDSDVWWFKIEPLVIQPIVVPLKPEDKVIINSSWVELKWTLNYTGPITKVRYNIYIDNTTDDRNQMRLVNSNYKQLFYGLNVDDGKTYHWFIIPSIEVDEGFIVGEFQGGVSTFFVNYSHVPPPEPGFKIKIDIDILIIQPGNTTIINIQINNTGNVELTINITYEIDTEDILFISLPTRRIVLAAGESKTIPLTVSASPNAKKDTPIGITINAVADDFELTDAETLSIDIDDASDDKGDQETSGLFSGENSYLLFLVLFIIVIIILLAFFAYAKIKRNSLLQNQRREMIFDYVKAHPGEHFRGIQKALNLEVGVVTYHINKLEREEFIKSRQDGQYRRFYPMDAKIDVKLILSQIQENILNWIKRNPGVTGTSIATQLGVDKKLVQYHVNVLQNAGFIYTEQHGREKFCYSAAGV